MHRLSRFRLTILLIFTLLNMPVAVFAANIEFQKSSGISIEVMTKDEFNVSFGSNPDVPLSNSALTDLAKKLFQPYGKKDPVTETDASSREYELGLLFGAMRNPSISRSTLDAVDNMIAAAVPPLPKTYTSGHFRFFYTDNDPDPKNNVTLAQIQATATALNAAWTSYATNFRLPKYYVSGGKKMIDIKVYDLGAGLFGETNSGWNYINLSSNLTVADACRRKTMPAHELFHRVQYAYGYISGTTDMSWMVEGTAVWAQKFTNASVGDYIAWMIAGLNNPDRDLMTERSLDAAHFWVYLEKRAGWDAIRDVWQTYSTNGKLAKEAVNTVTTAQLGLSFDLYASQWAQANVLKDTKNSGIFDYDEDELPVVSCGVTYGPLTHVPKTSIVSINSTTSWGKNSSLKPFGADYFVFNLDTMVTFITIALDGNNASKLRYYILGLKNNSVMSKITVAGPNYTYNKSLSAGQWDKIIVIAIGGSTGGTYAVKINNPCFAGKWFDSGFEITKEYFINQVATGLTGWVTSDICIKWNINGTYTGNDLTMTMSGSPNTVQCCNWSFSGFSDTGCTKMTGSWANVISGNCTGEGGPMTILKSPDITPEPYSGPMPGLAR